MKQRHLKALTSLLLVVMMLASMLPAIPVTVTAADGTKDATLSFADTAQRISFSTSIQVWEQNGIILTNEKGSSTSNIGDYSNPARFYKSSKITITAPGNITQIVFTASSSSYATALKSSITEATVSGSTVTITLDGTSETFTIASLTGGQVRMNSLTVTYQEPAPACDHANTYDDITTEPTCTVTGLKDVICSDCGETIEVNVVVDALGHTDENPADSKCDTCGTNLCAEHVWVDGEVLVEGDCTTDRVVSQVCDNCGEPGEHRVEKAPGHTAVEDEAVDPTCTEAGKTAGSHCSVCSTVIVAQTTVDALGHNFVDGTCDTCGEEQPSELTISFASTAQRTEYSSSKQVWSNGGLVFTNNKASSTSNVGDYSNPVRLYKSSQVVIDGPAKIIKAVFVTPGGDYGSAIKASLEAVGYTVSANGSTYTVTFAEAVENITFTLTGQGRINTLTVEFEKSCSHSETVAIGEAKDATCTEDGITAGSKCAKCGEILVPQETITAPGHTDANGDYVCDVEDCQEILCTEHVWVDGDVKVEGDCTTDRVVSQVCDNCGEPGEHRVEKAPGHTAVEDEAVDPTCTEAGKTAGSHCDVCKAVIVAQTTVPALGHNYVDGTCSVCGEKQPTEVTNEYTFSNYPAGTQYAKDEEHKLDDYLTVITTECHFTSELRIYSSSTNNGFAVLKAANGMVISKITANAGYKVDTLVIYGSNDDGATWTTIKEVSVDSTSYKDYTAEFGDSSYKWIKLDVAGSNQIRLKSITVTFENAAGGTTPDPVEQPKLQNYNVSLTEGIKISFEYNVPTEWLEANPGAYVKFNNENTPLVSGINTFTVTLTPKRINEALSLVLCDANGNEINTYDVSFSKYYEKAYAQGETNALNNLLDAIVNYGKAATGEAGSITEEFTNDGAYTKEDNDHVFGQISASLAESATIKLQINEANIQDTYKIKVTHKGDTIANGNLTSYISDGYLIIHNIYAADFDEEFTIEIRDGMDGDPVANATLSFNQYLKALYNSGLAEVTTEVKSFIAATYQYGLAVENYLNPSAE